MKKIILAAIAATSALVAVAPANAVAIVNGSANLTFTQFSTVAATRGTQAAIQFQTGQSQTIAGSLLSAVYSNTLGGLDFYFQVARTGDGTVRGNQIDGLNVAFFDSFAVEGYVDGTDFDGAGAFTATNNGTNSRPGGVTTSTTTVGRSADGNVVQIAFGDNGLEGTENSATYILRTTATTFDNLGFAVVTNSTGFNVASYEPTAAVVPEPATWGMMLVGFGLIGMGSRRSRRVTSVLA